jgi:TPP-dependent pyruvate/acetoin dehydrogenase alpha subunit
MTPTAVALYRVMCLIRAFELRLRDLVAGTPAARFTHLGVGQEAVAAGACAALGPGDRVALTYRNHAVQLARGADPAKLLAETLGRPGGYCTGRAGSMHVVAREVGVIDASAIVSGNIPIGSGSAFASRYTGDGAVTVCFFGDGAVGEGAFHEAMNIAALWRLPAVYLCENNGFAMATPFAATSPVASVADRAAGYGVPAASVDGNDAFVVHAAVCDAVHRARGGAGPSLVECRTQLLEGHFVGRHLGQVTDPQDPLAVLRPSVADPAAAEAAAAIVVDRATAYALASGATAPC